MTWDPALYLRFGDERTQPARDLLAGVAHEAPTSVIDLGCGPGNSTAVLRARWPRAHITGLDSSPSMLDEARRRDGSIAWVLGDVARWIPEHAYDVIFANAVLHWVPAHRPLLASWLSRMAEGGALAFQVPQPPQSVVHEALATLVASAEWRARFRELPPPPEVAAPADYHATLEGAGARVASWVTEYHHVLADAAAAVDWVRATGLRPYLDALDDDDARAALCRALEAAVAARSPRLAGGRVLFAFRRLFVVATR
ncbi:MAG: methyltransferase domain-containing protein [Gemmatimonadaceae bacterium]|jgi:trans-aconitate 2-methyltransferase|nr:methyltransferase domain-containing protein [Gemmatimonadaceae bacterium]